MYTSEITEHVNWVDPKVVFIDITTREYSHGGKKDKCAIVQRRNEGHKVLAVLAYYKLASYIVDNPDQIIKEIKETPA
jgi:hypothetical protein